MLSVAALKGCVHESATPSEPPLPVSEETAPPPVSRTRWGIHLLLVVGYIVAVGAIRASGDQSTGPVLSGNPRDLVLISCVQLSIFAVIFGLAWLASRASRDDLLLRWRNGLWFVPLGVGYSIALRLALAVIIVFITVVVMALGLV